MPRASAEAKAGAAYRAGAEYREPPAHLSKSAKAMWNEIVRARPVDYFAPGSFELLEQYCELMVVQRGTLRRLARGEQADPKTGASYLNRARDLAQTLATLATKLRVSIQASVNSKAGKLSEKGAGETAADPLIGGAAVWGDKPRSGLAN